MKVDKTVFISGIGGTGTYYLAKYFLQLGWEVLGSDRSENERVRELKTLGAQIFDSAKKASEIQVEVNLYIYAAAITATHPERVYFHDLGVETWEVGQFTAELIDKYFSNQLDEQEIAALQAAELMPLLDIDWDAKKYIGVTGTDGKTTTTTMIYHALRKLGKKAAVITTLGMQVEGKLSDTGLHTTTPTAQQLYQLLTSPELAAVDYVVLEVTSHGLAMGRVAGAKFDVAIITNITSEHLDYHKTWENYFQAKASLLTKHLKANGVACLNQDDPKSFELLQKLVEQVGINYKTIPAAELKRLKLPEYMDTDYNRHNAAQASLAVSTVTNERLAEDTFYDLEQISGRMQYLQQEPFKVIVDFAHTAASLREVLETLRAELPETGKLHAVFGCAGERDKTKRQPMGKAAFDLADYIYLVPEDPRGEELEGINQEILEGMGVTRQGNETELYKDNKTIYLFEEFNTAARKAGITAALQNAKAGDTVAILGKGHEQSLCFGVEEQEWNDIAETKKLLQLT